MNNGLQTRLRSSQVRDDKRESLARARNCRPKPWFSSLDDGARCASRAPSSSTSSARHGGLDPRAHVALAGDVPHARPPTVLDGSVRGRRALLALVVALLIAFALGLGVRVGVNVPSSPPVDAGGGS